MLTIKIVNDGTGTSQVGNYRYQVMVNETVIESGEVKGHKRGDWRKLVAMMLENSLFWEHEKIGEWIREAHKEIDAQPKEEDA
ncbi:MAG: hypothetical protein WC657_03770 [Candidatus Paceibacterota bacterium]|jgi:hypothetical protein